MNAKTISLHGDIDEKLYMEQLDRLVIPGTEDSAYKLKSLYGSKQASRQWYKTLMLLCCCIGLKGVVKIIVFIQKGMSVVAPLVLYANDILFFGK